MGSLNAKDSQWEARRQEYTRQRSWLEEEQERTVLQDRRRIERYEQMRHELDAGIDRIHSYISYAASSAEGFDGAAAHQAVVNATEADKLSVRRTLDASVAMQQEHRREYDRKLDDLERQYRREQSLG